MPKMELVVGLSATRRWPGWPTSIALRVDTGSTWMNRAVHGFLNVGAVAACKVAAEDTSDYLIKGRASKHTLEHTVKSMCKEGAYWGAAAGVYEAVEYGVERVRNRYDWTNAMIGGAITGALISATTTVIGARNNNNSTSYRVSKVIKGAITGGAVAAATELVVSQRRRRHVHASSPSFTVPYDDGTDQSDTNGNSSRSWESRQRRHRRHEEDDESVDDDEEGPSLLAAVPRGRLELPSSEVHHIPGWPAGNGNGTV